MNQTAETLYRCPPDSSAAEPKPHRFPSRPCPKASMAGVVTSFEMALRFNAWAQALTVPLTPQLIQAHYNVSRATSYRWLRAYNDACVAMGVRHG